MINIDGLKLVDSATSTYGGRPAVTVDGVNSRERPVALVRPLSDATDDELRDLGGQLFDAVQRDQEPDQWARNGSNGTEA